MNFVPYVAAAHPLDRTTSILLIDAFGGGLLADLDFTVCYIGGEVGDCAEAKSKLNDVMNN